MSQFTAPRPRTLSLRKPRNPLVAPALMRQAGRHGNHSAKAQRQSAQRSLLQEVRQLLQHNKADRSP